jgi:hypothetical protein
LLDGDSSPVDTAIFVILTAKSFKLVARSVSLSPVSENRPFRVSSASSIFVDKIPVIRYFKQFSLVAVAATPSSWLTRRLTVFW